MLNTILFLIVLFTLSLSAYSQAESDDATLRKELFSTYGFCKGQEFSLQNISNKFPTLQLQALRVKSEFQTTFGKSCDYIGSLFSEEVRRTLDGKLQQFNNIDSLTVETANAFIIKVRERAKGEIDSPWKETLLVFNPDFEENPAWEFSRGFVKKYETVNHPKAKGLSLEIKVPFSWKAREGNRPNIVQFFKGKNGYGEATFAFQVRDFTPPKGMKITQKDLNELFSVKGLKDVVDENSTLIESKPIVLEGQKGGMIIYDSVAERLDIKLKVRTLTYVTVYNNRMILLQFAVGNTEDKINETVKEFNKNRPLFQLIANSLVILDKYK